MTKTVARIVSVLVFRICLFSNSKATSKGEEQTIQLVEDTSILLYLSYVSALSTCYKSIKTFLTRNISVIFLSGVEIFPPEKKLKYLTAA